MELYMELLKNIMQNEKVEITFPNLNLDAKEMVSTLSYQVLREIVEVVRDDTLDDPECFERIERIVSILERNGIDIGNRHDFG